MIKIIVAFMMIVLFMIPSFADNVSLSYSVDDSNNTVNMLGDLMRNDPAYDPYNEFVIMRSGEREYRLYFGRDLEESSIKYVYVPSYMQTPASLIRSISASGLNITANGNTYVGNVPGSLASSTVDNYKTNYVLTICCIVIVVFVVFKLFRRQRSGGDRYYRVR